MSRRSLRSLAAWWLLVLMALTVTPRGLLHQCGRADGAHQAHAGGAALKNVCPVCDVALPVAIAEDIALVSGRREISAPLHAPPVVARTLGHERNCADRGPPSA